jgi:hypothetical protein
MEKFEDNLCQFFFNGLVEFSSESCALGLFFVGGIFIAISTSLVLMDVVMWLISSWFNFDRP